MLHSDYHPSAGCTNFEVYDPSDSANSRSSVAKKRPTNARVSLSFHILMYAPNNLKSAAQQPQRSLLCRNCKHAVLLRPETCGKHFSRPWRRKLANIHLTTISITTPVPYPSPNALATAPGIHRLSRTKQRGLPQETIHQPLQTRTH